MGYWDNQKRKLVTGQVKTERKPIDNVLNGMEGKGRS
jgi:hypothetical protein